MINRFKVMSKGIVEDVVIEVDEIAIASDQRLPKVQSIELPKDMPEGMTVIMKSGYRHFFPDIFVIDIFGSGGNG